MSRRLPSWCSSWAKPSVLSTDPRAPTNAPSSVPFDGTMVRDSTTPVGSRPGSSATRPGAAACGPDGVPAVLAEAADDHRRCDQHTGKGESALARLGPAVFHGP